MTTLQLLRHGKSDWHAGQDDRSRPLNPRGERTAAMVGRHLTAVGQQPDLVLCSTAVRARSTAELAAAAGRWQASVRPIDALYLPSVDAVLDVVARHGADAGRLLVVGHEPTWSGLVGHLTSAAVRYPTGALAIIDVLARSWADVVYETRGELRAFLPPTLLGPVDDDR